MEKYRTLFYELKAEERENLTSNIVRNTSAGDLILHKSWYFIETEKRARTTEHIPLS